MRNLDMWRKYGPHWFMWVVIVGMASWVAYAQQEALAFPMGLRITGTIFVFTWFSLAYFAIFTVDKKEEDRATWKDIVVGSIFITSIYVSWYYFAYAYWMRDWSIVAVIFGIAVSTVAIALLVGRIFIETPEYRRQFEEDFRASNGAG